MGIQQMLLAVSGAFVPPPVFKILDSVRLRSLATAYFSQTFGTPTNQNIWTYDGWVKRGKLGALQHLFDSGAENTNEWSIRFDAADKLQIVGPVSGTITTNKVTAAVFRDPSAWYHIHVEWNMTLVTADRCKLWVNGVENTTWTTNTGPTANSSINSAVAHRIGNDTSLTGDFDGFVAAQYFIDGQNVAVTSFGEFNTSGVWVPKAYAGTYGNNGFHLDFADKALTAGSNVGLGKDVSGNANFWNTTNISVAAGTTYDAMVDTPTNNYATLNPLKFSGVAPSQANLAMTAGATHPYSFGTMAIPRVGKYYIEIVNTTLTSASVGIEVAIGKTNAALLGTITADKWGIYTTSSKNLYRNTVNNVIAGTFPAGSVIQLACDLANNQAWLGVDNVWFNGSTGTDGNPSAGVNPTFSALPVDDLFVAIGPVSNTLLFAAGQAPLHASATYHSAADGYFKFEPPTGFVAFNTDNLQPPVAPIASGTFTGNGLADGPFVWTGGVPVTLIIDGSANLVGTAGLDVTAGGFKLRSATNNAAGTRSWTATYATPSTNSAFSQPQPAQKNP